VRRQWTLRRNLSFLLADAGDGVIAFGWLKVRSRLLNSLRHIFAKAGDQDFLVKDPARKVTVPIPVRDTGRTTLTWWQLRGALSKLDLRDRVLLELDMTNALRPGELFALRGQCFSHTECTMGLVETVYKGKIRP
jgi:hypothetical protein